MNVKFFCGRGMNLLEFQVNEWIKLNEVEVQKLISIKRTLRWVIEDLPTID